MYVDYFFFIKIYFSHYLCGNAVI